MKPLINLLVLITLFTSYLSIFNSPLHAFDIRCVFFNSNVYNNSDGTDPNATPCTGNGTDGPNNLGSIYNPIVRTLFTIGGVMSFVGLLYGGFMYIMGAGGSDTAKLQAGQQAITWSLVGLAIMFSIYWIVQIIEIITDLNILNPTL